MADKPGLDDLMKKAQEMQEKMQSAQKDLADMVVVGKAGGDLVSIEMTGRHDVKRVLITEDAMKEAKEEGKDVLEDLVAAAIRDAIRKIEQASQEKMVSLTKDLGLPAKPEDYLPEGGEE